jgi:hypothetical protein
LLAGGGDLQLIVMRQTSGEKTTSFQMLLSNNPLKTTSQNKPSQQTKQIKSKPSPQKPKPNNTPQQQQQKNTKGEHNHKIYLVIIVVKNAT